MLKVITLRALKDNFIYLLADHENNCAVIDPGETTPVEIALQQAGLKLDYVLCTHHHPDHVGGAPELLERHGAEAWASTYDTKRLAFNTIAVNENGKYHLFGEELQVIEIPGHTLGQLGFYFPNLKSVFVGDTLFSGGCGRLFEGTPQMMFESLQKLKSLPQDTQIYVGHEYTLRNLEFIEQYNAAPIESVRSYKEKCQARILAGLSTTPTTLSQELLINPFLRAASVAEFVKWRELRNYW